MSFESTGAETSSGQGGVERCSPNTRMIAEDQALIGLALQVYLEQMGLDVCKPLPSVAEALEWRAMNTPAIAVLDYALKDGSCTTLIRTLEERGIRLWSNLDTNGASPRQSFDMCPGSTNRTTEKVPSRL